MYDGSKKLETTSSGVSVTGQLSVSNTHFNYGSGSNYITQADDQVTYFRNTTGTTRSRIHSDGSYRTEDNIKLVCGTGQDMAIYHDGTNSIIDNDTNDLYIRSQSDIFLSPQATESGVNIRGNGNVELYYDSSKKLETGSHGISVTGYISCSGSSYGYTGGDNVKLSLGNSNDLQIYHDGSNSFTIHGNVGNYLIKSGNDIYIRTGGDDSAIDCIEDGAVKLYHNNSEKFRTESYGAQCFGELFIGDGNGDDGGTNHLRIGNGGDLKLYHDGSHSFIEEGGTGELKIASSRARIVNAANTATQLKATENAAVELFYDNSRKFGTKSYGVEVVGQLSVGTTTVGQSGEADNLTVYDDAHGGITIRTGTSHNGSIYFADGTSSDQNYRGSIQYRHADDALTLKTDATERLRITSSGDVYIGNSDTTGGHLFIYGKNGNDEPAVIEFHGKNSAGGGNPKAQIKGQYNTYAWASDLRFFTQDHNINLTEHFRIDFQGNLTATDTTIGSISDSRLKTNIADYTYDLTKFKQFQPKTFDWKNPVQHGSKSGVRGFLAQDLEAVDSVYVSNCLVDKTVTKGNADGTSTTSTHPDLQYLESDGIAKSSKFGEKDAMYISVINQLIAKIETLETKVAALEAA